MLFQKNLNCLIFNHAKTEYKLDWGLYPGALQPDMFFFVYMGLLLEGAEKEHVYGNSFKMMVVST